MIPIEKITGRLGNKMFQFASLYAYSRDLGEDYFLQDEKFFIKYENDIRRMYGTDIGFTPFTSIHVRRGDYLKYPQSIFHTNLCDTDYYDKAISLFPKNTDFLVFSDDIEWCKGNFKGSHFQFVEGNDEIVDMNMIASCTNHIIANSTFSWWAAWLCPNYAKTIISPKEDQWFYDGIIRCKIPKEWRQISFKKK